MAGCTVKQWAAPVLSSTLAYASVRKAGVLSSTAYWQPGGSASRNRCRRSTNGPTPPTRFGAVGGNWKRSGPAFWPSPSTMGPITSSMAREGSRNAGFGPRSAPSPGSMGEVRSRSAFTTNRKSSGTASAMALNSSAGMGL